MVFVADTVTDTLLVEDSDSEVSNVAVSEAVLDRVVLGRRVRVGDWLSRERVAVDETLRKTEMLAVLFGVILSVSRS